MSIKIFKTIKGKNDDHSVILEVENGKIIKYNCDCHFFSFYGWAKRNLINNIPKQCKHIKQAIEEYKNENNN